MLTDSEIVDLRQNAGYLRVLENGLREFVADIVREKHADFRPEIGTVIRIIKGFIKNGIIRDELARCTASFLERLINRDQKWERSVRSLKSICEAQAPMFIWMRFDEGRVRALFGRAENCFTDAEFRAVVKDHSSLPNERGDIRLAEIFTEIQLLLEKCIMHFATKGAYDTIVNIRKEEYYRINEENIVRAMLGSGKEGFLGLPPPEDHPAESDEEDEVGEGK